MNLEEAMGRVNEIQKLQQALHQQYSGLINLHGSAALMGNVENEAKYRLELHETLDMLLDTTVQMSAIKVSE